MSQNLSTRHQAKDLDEEGEAGEGSDSDNKTSDSDEHSIVGPLPPGHESSGKHKRSEKAAVTMPTVEDLDLQKGNFVIVYLFFPNCHLLAVLVTG